MPLFSRARKKREHVSLAGRGYWGRSAKLCCGAAACIGFAPHVPLQRRADAIRFGLASDFWDDAADIFGSRSGEGSFCSRRFGDAKIGEFPIGFGSDGELRLNFSRFAKLFGASPAVFLVGRVLLAGRLPAIVGNGGKEAEALVCVRGRSFRCCAVVCGFLLRRGDAFGVCLR